MFWIASSELHGRYCTCRYISGVGVSGGNGDGASGYSLLSSSRVLYPMYKIADRIIHDPMIDSIFGVSPKKSHPKRNAKSSWRFLAGPDLPTKQHNGKPELC